MRMFSNICLSVFHVSALMTLIYSKVRALISIGKFIPAPKTPRSTRSTFFPDRRYEMTESSGLAHIEVKGKDPFVLFKDWQNEARTFSTGVPNAFCLSTVSRDGKVSARHVVLRRLDKDGFVLMTDRRGRKAQDLREVPSATMCFLWAYNKDNGEAVARQVRIDGTVAELRREEFEDLYEREPLYCKIRSHICHQNSKVDWEELKMSHDKLLQEVEKGEADLSMPDHCVGYKITPSTMEFYHARDHLIADRVIFEKDSITGDWNHHHLAA